MLAAKSRASCVACGQTSRLTLVVTMGGLRIPAKFAVALSMHPTRQVGRQGWFVVGKRSACSKVWMQLQQTVQKNKRDIEELHTDSLTSLDSIVRLCIVVSVFFFQYTALVAAQ